MRETLVTTFALLLLAGSGGAQTESKMIYPKTRLDAVKEIVHGVTIADPYRWLEDVKAGDTVKWMAEQDQLARGWLSKLPGRTALSDRLRELYYVDSITAPEHRGNRWFYARRQGRSEKPIHYVREGENGPERVLLDPNRLSKDGTISVGAMTPSWDGAKVAYLERANNSDEGVMKVMDVATGKVSERDSIPGLMWTNASWTPAGDAFYYTWLPSKAQVPEKERPGHAEVRLHRLGTDPAKDEIMFPATRDPRTWLGGWISRDGHWLFVTVEHGDVTNDVYVRDLLKPGSKLEPFVVGVDALFRVEDWRDRFYVRTNDGAPNYKLYRVDPRKPKRSEWVELVPEQKDAVLQGASVVGEHLSLSWLKNASNTLEVRTLDGKPVRTVKLPLVGSSSGFLGNEDEDTAYYAFVSFTQPLQIFKTSVATGATSLWAEVKVPVDPSQFTVEQVWYPSKDGTKVSMFLVHKKGVVRDGSTPWLLWGYGGFNISETPSFSGGIFPWLEAGGGYAVANLRGGGEYGERWHRAGMLDKKQNVFDDFIAAAEFLVKEKWTRPDRLAIRGGSNGGLLVGAVTTQRPDLFRAVICQVPLLDMLRYHLFGAGQVWVPEYGSADDPLQFKSLLSYSPYHHVKAGTRYPAFLMMSADADDRVDPLHARKMVAALQAANAGEHPILLRIESHAGHGGADLIKQTVDQQADAFAFLMHELGLTAKNSANK
jgi:prolyl oligopeptidase